MLRFLTILGLSFLMGCAAAPVDRTSIKEESTIIVLSTQKDEVFLNRFGATIFEKNYSEYAPLEDIGIADKARLAVQRKLDVDPKFTAIDTGNVGAEVFVDHVPFLYTDFFEMKKRKKEIQDYCSEHGNDYLLLLQPGHVVRGTVNMNNRRGFGLLQQGSLGEIKNTSMGYSSMVLLFDCATGKEIESLDEHRWDELENEKWIELPESGLPEIVEKDLDKFIANYLEFIEATVMKMTAFVVDPSST